MIDWWQALILSVAGAGVGGLITLTVSYATHGWTTKAALEAAERETARRAAEEERQARRQHRRERIQPVRDFLRLAREQLTLRTEAATYKWVYEHVPDDLKEHRTRTLEDLQKRLSQKSALADFDELARSYMGAVSATTTSKMLNQVKEAFNTVHAIRGWETTAEALEAIPQATAAAFVAIMDLENQVERYVTEV